MGSTGKKLIYSKGRDPPSPRLCRDRRSRRKEGKETADFFKDYLLFFGCNFTEVVVGWFRSEME